MKFTKSDNLRKLSHALIPGGAHTYSKGDDQFPQLSPGFIIRGEGSYVWDLDGNKFLDWGMGLRTTVLGHGYRPVVEVVKKHLDFGANFPRPSVLEVELAQLLTRIIPCAEMVKLAKNGSTVTTAAVKLARAYTNRDKVALCADLSFFSYDDWYIGSTVINRGVPKAVQDLTLKFNYNDIKSVEKLFAEHPDQIACVILEPATEIEPKDDFLKKLKELCERNGAVLIFDEMISGFRWHLSGAQYVYGVTPDLATFGKSIANGFSMAALVGKKEIMSLGGIEGQHERVFLISSTHGAENHTVAAAIETIKEMERHDVIKHIRNIGKLLKTNLNEIHQKYQLDNIMNIFGEVECRLAMSFKDHGKYNSFQIKTFFFQELIQRGILFNGYFVPSFAHGEEEIKKTEEAWAYACQKLKQSLENGDLEKNLVGEPVKPVFRKFN